MVQSRDTAQAEVKALRERLDRVRESDYKHGVRATQEFGRAEQNQREQDALQARIDAGMEIVVGEIAKERVSDMVGHMLCRVRDALNPYVPPADDGSEAIPEWVQRLDEWDEDGSSEGEQCDDTPCTCQDAENESPPFHVGQWVQMMPLSGEPFEPFQVTDIGRDTNGEWWVTHSDSSGPVPIAGLRPWQPVKSERVTGETIGDAPSLRVTGCYIGVPPNVAGCSVVDDDSGDHWFVHTDSLRPGAMRQLGRTR